MRLHLLDIITLCVLISEIVNTGRFFDMIGRLKSRPGASRELVGFIPKQKPSIPRDKNQKWIPILAPTLRI